jgi:thiamine transporter
MERVRAHDRTIVLVEIALSIALAVVLAMLRVWKMPQGGTVSLAMVPLFVLALRRGPLVGVLAGALYGLTDFFVDPYPPVHWIQPLLDYPVAYALCGAAGVFASTWRSLWREGRVGQGVWRAVVPGVALGTLLRYGAHVVSGAVFFGEYAPAGQPVLAYSLVYNTFALVAGAVCSAAVVIVLPAVERVRPAEGGSR